MSATSMDRFERVLQAIGTKGVAEKTGAISLLSKLVDSLEPAHQAEAKVVLDRFAAASDFVSLWSELQAFAPFLEYLAPPPVTAELPEMEPLPEPPELPKQPPGPAAKSLTQPRSAVSHPSPTQSLDEFRWDAPPLPEEMLIDFFAEVAEHLDEVSQLVLSVKEADDPDMYELYRKLHTVKGNSGMVGLNELQEVAHGMEDVVKELRSRGEAPSDELRKVLADGAELALAILRLAEESGTGQLPVSIYGARLRAVLAGEEAAEPPGPTPEPVTQEAPTPPGGGEYSAAGMEPPPPPRPSRLRRPVTQAVPVNRHHLPSECCVLISPR